MVFGKINAIHAPAWLDKMFFSFSGIFRVPVTLPSDIWPMKITCWPLDLCGPGLWMFAGDGDSCMGWIWGHLTVSRVNLHQNLVLWYCVLNVAENRTVPDIKFSICQNYKIDDIVWWKWHWVFLAKKILHKFNGKTMVMMVKNTY